MPPEAKRTASPDSPEVLSRVHEGLDLVEIIARQMRRQLGPSVDVDEMAAYGREGLLRAARSFDPGKGVPFRRWANLRVRGAMIDGMRAGGGLPRRVYQKLRAMTAADHTYEAKQEELAASPPKTPEEAEAHLKDSLASAAMAMALGFLTMSSGDALDRVGDERELQDEEVARKQLVAKVRAAIEERPEQEKKLLLRHYFDDVTMEEAATELGLSKSWASRLHARAIEGVVKALKRADVTI